MAELRVRRVHPHVIQRLNEIAKTNSISREELLRKVLEQYTLTDLLSSQETELSAKVSDLNALLIEHLKRTDKIFKLLEEEVGEEIE